MNAPSRNDRRVADPEREMLDAGQAPYADRPRHVAPDGQRVVDQSADRADERQEIERNAERTMSAARLEEAREPSVRFWQSRRAQVGPLLALFAGLFTLAVRTWPIATPQGRGTVGTAWFICATIAGVLYLAGFWFSDTRWKQARVMLICGAVLHLLVSFLASYLVDAQGVAPAWEAMLFDVVPAVLAIVAAFLIVPAPDARHE